MDTEESFQQDNQVDSAKSKRFTRKKPLAVILIVIAVGVLGYFAYSLLLNQKTPEIQEANVLKEYVSKLIEVPANETPTMATVNDKTKLNSQDFFKNSENGDKVLIFEQAKKAYLYRPSTNKIVEVTLISTENSADTKPANNQ